MLPIMCIQPACMNIAVRMVTQRWPATIVAGISDQRITNAPPPASSIRKASPFTRTIAAVTAGNLRGRRDASASGIIPPTLLSSVLFEARPLAHWPLPLGWPERGREAASLGRAPPTAAQCDVECNRVLQPLRLRLHIGQGCLVVLLVGNQELKIRRDPRLTI